MMPTESFAMENTTQHYAWGSRSLLAALRGEPPTAEPEAELWFGAHSSAPSRIIRPGFASSVPLDSAIAENPDLLGEHVKDRHGRLPYLLKLLAAAEPLSLQAHPNLARARAGFARENAAGLSLGDPMRSYKDDNHKPELICALTPFRALSGFREPAATANLLDALHVELLEPIVRQLRSVTGPSGIVSLVETLLTMDSKRSLALARATGQAVSVCRDRRYTDELAVAQRVAETHPGDVGIVIALMLELVTLRRGEAIYLSAGRLHAYVDGLGVEIMAASDNVVRGGLTPKHVDVAELVAVLDGRIEPIEVLTGSEVGPGEFGYRTPATEFLLSRIDLEGGQVERVADGPEIVLVAGGEVAIDGVMTKPTEARFVPSGVKWEARGTGLIFRAGAGPSAA